MKERIPLSVHQIHYDEMLAGTVLTVIAFFMPLFVNVYNFGVMDSIDRALHSWDTSFLLTAAVRLVLVNFLRALPHYIGAFFISESLEFFWKDRRIWWPNFALIFAILLAVYRSMYYIHHFPYDFSLAAFGLSLLVLLYRRADYRYISWKKKTLLIVTMIMAFQFLDIMPALDGLSIGRGEISRTIKLLAQLYEGEALLNALGIVGITVFTLFSVIIFLQFQEENHLRMLALLEEKNRESEHLRQMSELQNRVYQEMQYLVHDLKSPLTSVQTLVGVMKMSADMEGREKDISYLNRIEKAMERMSDMVSAILYEKERTVVSVQELTDTALAQVSVTAYAEAVRVENNAAGAYVRVNRVLFPRAVVNLLRNAGQAGSPDRALEILLRTDRVREEDTDYVRFSVRDNGVGIPPENVEQIWEKGVSGRGSSGLGLSFVRRVVEESGGKVTVNTKPGEGTEMVLLIPEGENDEGR
ncbi:MAG: HAMP domain-containing histidine kinase [Clostridium sp.]|nr:HAMP domain-containing histidine kinase [Clostridium sp.]